MLNVSASSSSHSSTHKIEDKKTCCYLQTLVGGILAALGVLLLSLGLTQICGLVGSVGYIATVSTSGVALVAGILLIASGINKCPRESLKSPSEKIKNQKKPPVESKEEPSVEGVGNSSDENTILGLKKSYSETRDISSCLKSIAKEFFDEKSQERAKSVFSYAMEKLLGSRVAFPKAVAIDNPDGLKGKPKAKVFRVSETTGVDSAIRRASRDKNHLHVFQVASQYNCSEAKIPETPAVGEAMEKSEGDNTQGPHAQRTNPTAFELVTAFLTHLGFNMLHKVLPSAGSTYEAGSEIEHGYLMPSKDKKDALTEEFKENYSQAEYAVYTSLQKEWKGVESVHIMLQAAPASSYAGLTDKLDEMEKYAALANYTALFNYGIELAKSTGKPVVLHATVVGGGVFHNRLKNLQWGFEKAALALQDQMEAKQVFVQLESRDKTDYASQIATNLGIPRKERLGGG